MSEHILSCDCESKYFGIQAEWDTTDREGNPAVAYGVNGKNQLAKEIMRWWNVEKQGATK